MDIDNGLLSRLIMVKHMGIGRLPSPHLRFLGRGCLSGPSVVGAMQHSNKLEILVGTSAKVSRAKQARAQTRWELHPDVDSSGTSRSVHSSELDPTKTWTDARVI